LTIQRNIVIPGTEGRPILIDVFKNNPTQSRAVVFAHGFKGYKDWGAWDLVAKAFANAGFVFIKFNFSHNGGTAENPIDFPDLEAFGNNNYTKELNDLQLVFDWIDKNQIDLNVNPDNIGLIGHSRGGGVSILKANEDPRVKMLSTWAAVSDFGSRFTNQIEDWKEEGVIYILNGRTKQNMPLYYQFYEDYIQNEERLSIPDAAKNISIPWMIFHGEKDQVVPLKEAQGLESWSQAAKLVVIPGGDHTLGSKHS